MYKKERLIIDLYRADDWPPTVHGATTKTAAGHHQIMINGNDTEVGQLAAFLHEITHVYRHDLDKEGATAAEIEKDTAISLRSALDLLAREENP